MSTLTTTDSAVRDEALPLEALGDRRIREELSPGAARLFVRLADGWSLAIDQRQRLLGNVARQTYHNWAKGRVSALSRDQLERISLTLGIQKGLKLLFADEASAMRWFKSPNRDVPFGGRSPLERMLAGSIDDLYAVRRYIDAWRGIK